MLEKNTYSFIPKERGALPRILLLDFDKDIVQSLSAEGYTVYAGDSGLGTTHQNFPKHESEIEIILWDTSKLRNDQKIYTSDGDLPLVSHPARRMLEQISKELKTYFSRIRAKGGFSCIYLGDVRQSTANMILSDVLDVDFSFFSRRTSTLTIDQTGEDDVWYYFFNRFVPEKNIRYGIEWNDNCVGLERYFNDEDSNCYAVCSPFFTLVPKVDDAKKLEAVTFILQDVLPFVGSGKDIFPDKYYYKWANSIQYLPPRVQELKAENKQILGEVNQKIINNNTLIKAEMTESEYLSNMLIADDSDLFSKDKKLSTNVHKVLEEDLGFAVTDVDKMRLQMGEALKEDKWIEDNDGFFALVEIKGTEKGAKANWVRTDLNAHIKEFEVVKGVSGFNSVLIFNHERREEPEKREVPFNGDTDLVEYCKKSKILLIPVYDLFKMVRDIKRGVLKNEEARSLIKKSFGLFEYGKK